MSRLLLPLVLAVAGCSAGPPPSSSSPWLVESEGQKDVVSGSPVERFFPLVDGMVYAYSTTNEVGEEGMLIGRVFRADAKHGELRFPRGTKPFEFAPDGVMLAGSQGSYVLKAPIAVGTSWRGEHGGQSRILKVDVAADPPAGHYEGCVQTLEERSGDRATRWATTFCPDVGVVLLEVATGSNYERASLKSYAPPMRMRPDGSEKVPASQAPLPGF
jgi:hypothetical protein